MIPRQAGLEAVCHLVNRGRSRAEISSELRSASATGLAALLCLRGDHAAEDGPDTPRLREVVSMAGNELPQPLIGVTANQYGPRERVLANLAPKLRGGAAFVRTNPEAKSRVGASSEKSSQVWPQVRGSQVLRS